MKLLAVFFLPLLPSALAKNNLRQGSSVILMEDHRNLSPKVSPEEYRRSYTNQRAHRRLDANFINAAVSAILPALNRVIQSTIPDPVNITRATYTNSQNVSGVCGGSTITGTSTFDESIGTSSLAIQTLEVDEATYQFTFDCPTLKFLFSGDFNIVIGGDSVATTGSTTLSSTGCSANSTSTMTGTVTNPRFSGVVYLQGSISYNTATVDSYEIKSITATCDGTAIDYKGDFSSDFYTGNEDLGTMETKAATGLKNLVGTEINTLVTAALDEALAQARSAIGLGFGGGLPIIAGFYRAAAEETVYGLRDQAQGIMNGFLDQGRSFIGQYGF